MKKIIQMNKTIKCNKPGLVSYKAAYEACEEALKIKKSATSGELINYVIAHYNTHNLNLTSKGLTFHLKGEKYPKIKKYASRPWIFFDTEETKKEYIEKNNIIE